MLGGSFWIALLRNAMGAALILGIFLLLDRPRFPMKKMLVYYGVFGAAAVGAYSVWYMVDVEMFIRLSGLVTIPVLGIFCFVLSADLFYLSVYKLTLGFYMLSVTVFLGVDISRLWFHGNMWIDIALRVVIELGIMFIVAGKIRPRFHQGRTDLAEVMDFPSAVTLIIIVLIAATIAYWPDHHALSVSRVIRILILLVMAGIIQWMTFRMYLYRGREFYWRFEKELLEMNELLLRRQLGMFKAAGKEKGNEERICTNAAVNGICAAYETYAKEENIQVDICADIAENIAVREIDMAAILVSIFEKAIWDCKMSGEDDMRIRLIIAQNRGKVAIRCENTCGQRQMRKAYSGDWDAKAESVRKVVDYYNGEMERVTEKSVAISKILLDISMRQDDRMNV